MGGAVVERRRPAPDRVAADGGERGPHGGRRVARWHALFQWFRVHADLHSPVYIGFKEILEGEFRTSVYPKLYVALTASGSLVGLATCVVWT